MQFWFPGFLIACATILIPILVHLFSFRATRSVYFSDIRFLKDLKEENKNRAKLRHLLVLASRCLAVLMLVFAFAKPTFDQLASNSKGQKCVNVFVDNSFSMDAESSDGLNLEIGKAKAAGIAEAFQETDRFRLFTQDFEGTQSRLLTKEEFIEGLSRIKTGPYSHTLQEITDRMIYASANDGSRENFNYLISDFQSAPFEMEKFKGKSMVKPNFFLCPVAKSLRGNISVDSVWFSEPIALSGEQGRLMVQIQNHSDGESEEIPLSLSINGNQKALSSVQLGAGEKKIIAVSFLHANRGWQLGRVSLTDPETTFDNTFYFSYKVTEKVSVLQLCEKKVNPFIRAIFTGDSLIEYSEMSQADAQYQKLIDYDLIVLDGWISVAGGLADGLVKASSQGSSIAIIPPAENLDQKSYQTFLQSLGCGWFMGEDTVTTELAEINYGNDLYRGVFNDTRRPSDQVKLPTIKRHYRISLPAGIPRDLPLSLRNGFPFIAGFPSGTGRVYLLASSIGDESGNFHRHGIFVPSLFRMAFQKQVFNDISAVAGSREPIDVRNKSLGAEEIPRLISENSGEGIVPIYRFSGGKAQIFLENSHLTAGHYRLSLDGKDTLAYLSLNHRREESEQEFMTKDDLRYFSENNKTFKIIDSQAASIGKRIKEAGGSDDGWRIFLFFSLIFLFFELVLLKIKN